MSTGSIQNSSKTLFKHGDSYIIKKTFTAGEDLVAGDVVKISGDGIVSKAAAGEVMVGAVTIGGLQDATVTVAVTLYVLDAFCIFLCWNFII